MRLAFLLLADHSESVNGKLYANGAGWNMLRFPQLPVEFGFSIGVGIDVEWGETNQRQHLELEYNGPDGERVGDPFQLEFETGRPPGAIQGQDQRIVLSLFTRLRFETTGPHLVRATASGQELGAQRFYVVRVAVPGFPGVQEE